MWKFQSAEIWDKRGHFGLGREDPTWKTAAGINGGFWDEPGWTHLECEGGIKALQELSWKLQVVCPGKMGMGKAGGIQARNSLGKKKNPEQTKAGRRRCGIRGNCHGSVGKGAAPEIPGNLSLGSAFPQIQGMIPCSKSSLPKAGISGMRREPSGAIPSFRKTGMDPRPFPNSQTHRGGSQGSKNQEWGWDGSG